MVKVELDIEEAWSVMNRIIGQMLDETELHKSTAPRCVAGNRTSCGPAAKRWTRCTRR